MMVYCTAIASLVIVLALQSRWFSCSHPLALDRN